jgi:hypothetical protein
VEQRDGRRLRPERHVAVPHLDLRRPLGRAFQNLHIRRAGDSVVGRVCFHRTETPGERLEFLGCGVLVAQEQHLMLQQRGTQVGMGVGMGRHVTQCHAFDIGTQRPTCFSHLHRGIL